MGTKHHSSSDPTADSKRRRRAGFSKIDAGIEPKECIKIYLVSRKDEVLSPDSFQVEPIDLNQFFEEDGKIYGYQGLKITVWLSSISFHAYADISFESSSDGRKGITDLKSSLQNIFAENLVESKDDFLQTFSTECHYVKSLVACAEVLSKDALTDSSGNSICHFKEESINIEVATLLMSLIQNGKSIFLSEKTNMIVAQGCLLLELFIVFTDIDHTPLPKKWLWRLSPSTAQQHCNFR